MDESIDQIKKRFSELARRAADRGRCVSTEFLTLAEQDILLSLRYQALLEGGYPQAERRIAIFTAEGRDTFAPPIVCLCIRPVNPRFADSLTHRDYLGALMSLGIRRELLGDIVPQGNCGYLFCLESIAPYLTENLTQVRHTTVTVERESGRDFRLPEPVERRINVASTRLDALLAAVWKLSRQASQQLFARQLVYVNSRLTLSPGMTPREGDIITVRHLGRFVYDGISGQSRKGRLYVCVRTDG